MDLDSRQLRVRQALQRADGKLRIVEPKTSTSRRTVVLPRLAVQHLREHRRRQNRARQPTNHKVGGKAFRDAVVVEQLLASNLWSAPSAPGILCVSGERWSTTQARAFLDQARGHRLFAFYHLAAYTGARRGELLNLR